jgi:hypothetical protein
VGKILKVKVIEEYMVEPELKKVKPTMEWKDLPPDNVIDPRD